MFMRLIKPLLFVFSLFIGSFSLSAQDIHYTLFDMSPLALNPGLTGAFEGTARIGGIYRDQWSSFLGNQFTTPTFYIDAPIIRGFRKQDWVGIGVSFFQDEAGTLSLQTSGALFSASYHFALKEDQSSMLTLGIQGGQVQRMINTENASTAEMLQGLVDNNMLGQDTDLGNIRPNADYIDFSVGLLFRSKMSDRSNLEIGVSGAHVTTPEYYFQAANANVDEGQRPLRITAHASLGYGLNERWGIQPKVFFQTTAGFSETYVQGWANYLVNPEQDFTLNFGLGYRVGDAGKVLLGADWKDVRVAVAYDLTLSDLSEVNNNQGAFELSASYILKIYKEPQVKPAVFCPRF
jgi:type IX secretion system PorP/SprF family membrane protein